MNDENKNQNEEDSDQKVDRPELIAPRRRWLRLSIHLFLVLLIFISGMIIGGSLALHRMHDRMHNFERDRGHIVQRIHHRITNKYQLDEEQSAQAKQIIENHIDAVIALRQEIRPRLETQLQEFEDEMAELMDESQREEWRRNVRHFGKRLFPRF